MSSLASLVQLHILRRGDNDQAVRVLQLALSAAGYRVGLDGDFGPGTESAVTRFQTQHGLKSDGVVGPLTAALLDAPHAVLVETARPMAATDGWPHDDTASLIAFYGDPRGDLEGWKTRNVVGVRCPWPLFYESTPWPHEIQFHRRAAGAFEAALTGVWDAANHDPNSPLLIHFSHFSGSGEFRAIRGSSRLSCHAFWAAVDFDAEHLPLAHPNPPDGIPQAMADLFKKTGAFWGDDYQGRKDPMHFQYAHE